MASNSAQEDLAYVRAIAEEGRNVPLVSGMSFVIWGAIIGTTAMIQFLWDAGVIKLPINMMALWTTALVLGWTIGFITNRYIENAPGSSSLGNRIVNAAWVACGIFISIYWLALVVLYFRLNETVPQIGFLFATMFPVAFGLYGVAFFVTALAANQNWYRWVSFASWAISFFVVLILDSGKTMLLAAIGTYLVVLAPGVIMLRNQPSDIV